jgi:hypothetical protein
VALAVVLNLVADRIGNSAPPTQQTTQAPTGGTGAGGTGGAPSLPNQGK